MTSVAAVFQRLRSPRAAEQLLAVIDLDQIVMQSPADCDELVAAGCVPLLASMLKLDSAALQAHAAGALSHLLTRSHSAAEASAAAIPALVSLLEGTDELPHVNACFVLGSQALDFNAVVAAGGHTALLRHVNSDIADLRHAACHAFSQLTCRAGVKAALLAAEPWSALVSVLRRRASSSGVGSSPAATGA